MKYSTFGDIIHCRGVVSGLGAGEGVRRQIVRNKRKRQELSFLPFQPGRYGAL